MVAPAVEIPPSELQNYPSIYPYLAEHHGILLVRGDKTLEATLANEEEACLPARQEGRAHACLRRSWSYDSDDLRRLLIKAAYRGDRYKHFIRLAG